MARIGSAVVVLCAAPWIASAADDGEDRESYVAPNLWELNLSVLGSWNDVEGTDIEVTSVGGRGSLGYFITSWLEVGLFGEGQYQRNDFGDTDTESTFLLGGPEIILNLPTRSPFVPFAVGSGGVAYVNFEDATGEDSDDVGAFWQAGGGVRIFLNDWAAITLRATYQQLLFEDIADEDAVVGSAGISLFF